MKSSALSPAHTAEPICLSRSWQRAEVTGGEKWSHNQMMRSSTGERSAAALVDLLCISYALVFLNVCQQHLSVWRLHRAKLERNKHPIPSHCSLRVGSLAEEATYCGFQL